MIVPKQIWIAWTSYGYLLGAVPEGTKPEDIDHFPRGTYEQIIIGTLEDYICRQITEHENQCDRNLAD